MYNCLIVQICHYQINKFYIPVSNSHYNSIHRKALQKCMCLIHCHPSTCFIVDLQYLITKSQSGQGSRAVSSNVADKQSTADGVNAQTALAIFVLA